MKLWTSLCLFLLLGATAFAVRENPLESRLRRIIRLSNTDAGVAVISGSRNWAVGNRKRPLLSVFKFFIAVQTLRQMEQTGTALNAKLTVKENMTDANMYSPMLKKHPRRPFEISLAELLEYMIAESDNNAADILLEYSGGTGQLEKFLHDLGFSGIDIRVNEKQMNQKAENQYLNQAAPSDVAGLIKLVFEKDVLSAEHRKFLADIMIKTSTGADKIKLGLPPGVIFGHKTGSSSRTADGIKIADNDAGFVTLTNGSTYYIAVMITESKHDDRANAALAAQISQTVYNYLTTEKTD